MITGGCACGGVRYEISEPFVASSYCHCTRCQRRTGRGASANARVAEGSFTVVQGEELIRGWIPEGGGFEKCFCATCGSGLFSRNPETKGELGIRLGTVDGDPGIRPDKHQFTDYAPVWEPVPDDGLPRFPESARAK